MIHSKRNKNKIILNCLLLKIPFIAVYVDMGINFLNGGVILHCVKRVLASRVHYKNGNQDRKE